MSLLQQGFIAIRAWPGKIDAQSGQIGSKSLVKCNTGGHLLVVAEDLLRQLVDKLIEAQVNFGLYFIVEKLLLELSQRVVSRVIVQVQWV